MSEQLHWLTATELAKKIRAGELSARDALTSHWARIDSVNPQINAVIFEDRERAWSDAERADARQAAGEELGPLHGVPLTNKDSNDTAGMPNTWGSPLLRHVVPEQDSLIVSRLRSAGATLTGKNNVPEFAAGAHTFNEVYGTTRNPYALDRSAGGSSGGAAAAIASGIQSVGDGSDMGGSLRIPASFCNIYGLRPSRGRIPSIDSNSWAWLGRTGPMARELSDLALLMNVLSGPDRRSPTSIQETGIDFVAALDQPLGEVRVGWAADAGLGMPFEREVVAVAERAIASLVSSGVQVEATSPDISEADFVFEQTRAFDYEMALGNLVRGNPAQVKLEVIENVALGTRQTSAQLRELALARTRLEGRVRSYFDEFDLWITPTAQVLPFDASIRYPEEIEGETMPNYLGWMRSVCVISAMDVPVMSVPIGFSSDGLPVGLQIAAAHGNEALLLRAARLLEQTVGSSRTHPTLSKRTGS